MVDGFRTQDQYTAQETNSFELHPPQPLKGESQYGGGAIFLESKAKVLDLAVPRSTAHI